MRITIDGCHEREDSCPRLLLTARIEYASSVMLVIAFLLLGNNCTSTIFSLPACLDRGDVIEFESSAPVRETEQSISLSSSSFAGIYRRSSSGTMRTFYRPNSGTFSVR